MCHIINPVGIALTAFFLLKEGFFPLICFPLGRFCVESLPLRLTFDVNWIVNRDVLSARTVTSGIMECSLV